MPAQGQRVGSRVGSWCARHGARLQVGGPVRMRNALAPPAVHRLALGACISSTRSSRSRASALVAAHRADRADRAGAGRDLAAPAASGASPSTMHDALARGAAMLHAADHLLADEAALGEGDAVEQVEVGLVREGVAEGDSPCRLRARRARCGGRGSLRRRRPLRRSTSASARCDAWPPGCACRDRAGAGR